MVKINFKRRSHLPEKDDLFVFSDVDMKGRGDGEERGGSVSSPEPSLPVLLRPHRLFPVSSFLLVFSHSLAWFHGCRPASELAVPM